MKWWLQMLPLQASDERSGGDQVPPHGRGVIAPAQWVPIRRGGSRDAGAAAQVPNLLSSAVSSTIRSRSARTRLLKLGLCADSQDRHQLLRSAMFPIRTGTDAGAVLHQPLRKASSIVLFQVVHGEGLGCPVQSDQRRVGRATHQGPVGLGNIAARWQKGFQKAQRRRRAEGHARPR